MNKVPRISAKAVVVHDGALLVIRKKDTDGDYFILPGGVKIMGNLFQIQLSEK